MSTSSGRQISGLVGFDTVVMDNALAKEVRFGCYENQAPAPGLLMLLR